MKSFFQKSLVLLAAIVGVWSSIKAQNEADALRYSTMVSLGTARTAGLAGAVSSLGADFGAASLNPAGFGLYNRNEVQLTMGFSVVSANTDYLGENAQAASVPFVLPSLSYVFTKPRWDIIDGKKVPAQTGVRSFSLAFGLNQVAGFRKETQVSAYNSQNSITQFFADQAKGQSAADLAFTNSYAGLAYAAGLIWADTSGPNVQWLPAVKGGNVQQTIITEEKGYINDWNVAGGVNIQDFVYVGAALGITDLKYSYSYFHQEDDINNIHQFDVADSTSFSNLEFNDVFRTKGTGIHGKFGLIIRPHDLIRIGLSFRTPTLLSLTDDYLALLTATFDNDANIYGLSEDDNPQGRFSYRLTTPYKATAGLTILLKKWGFVTGDFEITDYSTARLLRSNSATGGGNIVSFSSENQAIKDNFRFAFNYRAAAEFRISFLRLRGGYAHYGAPVRNELLQYVDYTTGKFQQLNGSTRLITGGIGIKLKSFYLDLAYIYETSKSRKLLYTIDNASSVEPEIITQKTSNSILLTTGFTF